MSLRPSNRNNTNRIYPAEYSTNAGRYSQGISMHNLYRAAGVIFVFEKKKEQRCKDQALSILAAGSKIEPPRGEQILLTPSRLTREDGASNTPQTSPRGKKIFNPPLDK